MIHCIAHIISSSIAYLLRGMGWPLGTTSGRLLWSAVCGVNCFVLFGYAHGIAAILGAYLGMMFSHSKWYLFQRRGSAVNMAVINACRFFFLAVPAGPLAFPFAAAAGVLGALGYWLGVKCRDLGLTREPLRIAEPIVGAVFGGLLYLLSVFEFA